MHKRYFFSGLLIAVIFGCLLWVGLLPGYAAPVVDSNPADEVLQLVNEWRLQEGMWPLAPNETLQTMAQAQAEYIVTQLDSITSEEGYHLDAQGRNPRERAVQLYNWPSYTQPESYLGIGENAAVGNVRFALDFWKGSEIHRRAALNNSYQEVGVGVVAYKKGYLFIMDFGARPGVVAALTSVAGDKLYLGNDCLCGRRSDQRETKIRVFDTQGVPMTSSMNWQAVLRIEKSWGNSFWVLYSNKTQQQFFTVTVGKNTVNLPRSAVNFIGLQPTSSPTLTPTSAGNDTPATSSAPIAATATLPTATATTLPTTPADVLILYNKTALVVYSNAVSPIDLTGLVLGNTTGRVSGTGWQAVSNFLISAFPSGSCLSVSTDGVLPKNNCRFVRSSLFVPPSKTFWATANFTVSVRDAVVATCNFESGRCEVRLKPSK